MSDTDKPFFSVIIPCYNVEHTIVATIDSLINQTFNDFEIIFVNDGSTDKTREILENVTLNQNINIILQSNKGLGAARNSGIRASNGKYVAFLDADDIWENNKLQNVFLYLKSNDCDLVCHNEHVVDKNHKVIRKHYYGPYTKYEDLFFKHNCLSPSAVTIKKSIINKVGYFSENRNLHGVEDYDLWLRMAKVNINIKYIPDFLGMYVIHDNNMSIKYDFIDRVECLHIEHAKYINLNNYNNVLRYKMKMLKIFGIKIKNAFQFKKINDITHIIKDILFLLIDLKKYLSKRQKELS